MTWWTTLYCISTVKRNATVTSVYGIQYVVFLYGVVQQYCTPFQQIRWYKIKRLLLFIILTKTTLTSNVYDNPMQLLWAINADKSFLKLCEARPFIPALQVNFCFMSCAENTAVTHKALFHSYRAVWIQAGSIML